MDRPAETSPTSDPRSGGQGHLKVMDEKGVTSNKVTASSSDSSIQRTPSYKGIVDLPIHIVLPGQGALTQRNDVTITESNSTLPPLRPSVESLVMDTQVLKCWRQFGADNRLENDTQIADFLLNYYESSHSLSRCLSCHNILPLYCNSCTLCTNTPTHHTTTTTTTISNHHNHGTSPEFSTLLRAAELQSPPSPLKDATESISPPLKTGSKKKGRKKKTKVKSERHACKECGTVIFTETPLSLTKSTTKRTTATKTMSTSMPPYKCLICDAGFLYRQSFQDHLFETETDGRFRCCHCKDVFLNAIDMRKHVVTHMAAMRYQCPTCPLAFSLASNLKTHLRTHSGEKPYLCRLCGRAFTQSVALTVHLRKHTGEKPFSCPHCPMAFAASSNLSRHILKHTGQRPYRCSHCPAAFSQPGSLKTHVRSKHTGERPYVCENCSAAFSDHSTLWKHRRNNSCSGISAARGRKNVSTVTVVKVKPTTTSAMTGYVTDYSGGSSVVTLSTPEQMTSTTAGYVSHNSGVRSVTVSLLNPERPMSATTSSAHVYFSHNSGVSPATVSLLKSKLPVTATVSSDSQVFMSHNASVSSSTASQVYVTHNPSVSSPNQKMASLQAARNPTQDTHTGTNIVSSLLHHRSKTPSLNSSASFQPLTAGQLSVSQHASVAITAPPGQMVAMPAGLHPKPNEISGLNTAATNVMNMAATNVISTPSNQISHDSTLGLVSSSSEQHLTDSGQQLDLISLSAAAAVVNQQPVSVYQPLQVLQIEQQQQQQQVCVGEEGRFVNGQPWWVNINVTQS